MAEETSKEWRDISYLIVAATGLAAAVQVWRLRVKPWLIAHHLVAPGGVSVIDVIGVASIVVPLVVLGVMARVWLRRRKRAAELRKAMRDQMVREHAQKSSRAEHVEKGIQR